MITTQTRNPQAAGWRKGITIFGVVISFSFLMTIPGWIALRDYRRWRDGPPGKMPWPYYAGYVYLGLFAVSMLALIVVAAFSYK